MSAAMDRLMIEHLDKAVKLLTDENDELKERIERQAAYHDSEVAALQTTIRELRAKARRDDALFNEMVMAVLS